MCGPNRTRAEQALTTEGEGKAATRALMIHAFRPFNVSGTRKGKSRSICRNVPAQKVWKSIIVMVPDIPPPPSKRAAWAKLADVWKSRWWNHVSPAVLGPGDRQATKPGMGRARFRHVTVSYCSCVVGRARATSGPLRPIRRLAWGWKLERAGCLRGWGFTVREALCLMCVSDGLCVCSLVTLVVLSVCSTFFKICVTGGLACCALS